MISLRSRLVIPTEHRANFKHLYLDIAWFGLLTGSAMAFISVYLVRIGASAAQIGMMNAAPAVMAIALAIPSGSWLEGRPVDRSVFWTSVLHRFFYLLLIPLPVLFSSSIQIWIVIAVTLLMSIPGTALSVGFNAMYADVVPPDWRGHIVGVRNALLAIVTIITSLICGYLLDNIPFPLNYQLVFALGFIGAAMSSYHLHRIRSPAAIPSRIGQILGDQAQPGQLRTAGDAFRPSVALRYLTRRISRRLPHVRMLKGPYGLVLLSLFFFHFTQYLAIPLFPIFWVDSLGLSDQTISLGTALFYGSVFLGSTQLRVLIAKIGNHKVTVLGALLMASYPGLTAITTNVSLFLITSVVGGVAWSLAGGALGNYLLEKIPEKDRPFSLAWYMVSVNLAVLAGSLLGPAVAHWIGLVPALVMIAVGRVLSGLGIWWLGGGREKKIA